jgi:hypothetical protein
MIFFLLSITDAKDMFCYTSSSEGTAMGFTSLSRSMTVFMDRQAKGAANSDKFFRDREEIDTIGKEDDGTEPKGGGPLLH